MGKGCDDCQDDGVPSVASALSWLSRGGLRTFLIERVLSRPQSPSPSPSPAVGLFTFSDPSHTYDEHNLIILT